MPDKTAATSAPIHRLLARRWSPRAFERERPLSEADQRALAEAARWAPSSYGAEPWRMLFCDRNSDPEAHRRLAGCLLSGNAWAEAAPLLVLVTAAANLDNGHNNRHSGYDSGAAAFSLVLQAEKLGLSAHQMAGFDGDRARSEFAVPEDFDCWAVIAIGRRGSADSLNEALRRRELGGRQRQPLATRFFRGAWGRGLHG